MEKSGSGGVEFVGAGWLEKINVCIILPLDLFENVRKNPYSPDKLEIKYHIEYTGLVTSHYSRMIIDVSTHRIVMLLPKIFYILENFKINSVSRRFLKSYNFDSFLSLCHRIHAFFFLHSCLI